MPSRSFCSSLTLVTCRRARGRPDWAPTLRCAARRRERGRAHGSTPRCTTHQRADDKVQAYERVPSRAKRSVGERAQHPGAEHALPSQPRQQHLDAQHVHRGVGSRAGHQARRGLCQHHQRFLACESVAGQVLCASARGDNRRRDTRTCTSGGSAAPRGRTRSPCRRLVAVWCALPGIGAGPLGHRSEPTPHRALLATPSIVCCRGALDTTLGGPG